MISDPPTSAVAGSGFTLSMSRRHQALIDLQRPISQCIGSHRRPHRSVDNAARSHWSRGLCGGQTQTIKHGLQRYKIDQPGPPLDRVKMLLSSLVLLPSVALALSGDGYGSQARRSYSPLTPELSNLRDIGLSQVPLQNASLVSCHQNERDVG